VVVVEPSQDVMDGIVEPGIANGQQIACCLRGSRNGSGSGGGGCVKRNLGELCLDGERPRMSCESCGAACTAFSTARAGLKEIFAANTIK
jgi:hypothetical protein